MKTRRVVSLVVCGVIVALGGCAKAFIPVVWPWMLNDPPAIGGPDDSNKQQADDAGTSPTPLMPPPPENKP